MDWGSIRAEMEEGRRQQEQQAAQGRAKMVWCAMGDLPEATWASREGIVAALLHAILEDAGLKPAESPEQVSANPGYWELAYAGGISLRLHFGGDRLVVQGHYGCSESTEQLGLSVPKYAGEADAPSVALLREFRDKGRASADGTLVQLLALLDSGVLGKLSQIARDEPAGEDEIGARLRDLVAFIVDSRGDGFSTADAARLICERLEGIVLDREQTRREASGLATKRELDETNARLAALESLVAGMMGQTSSAQSGD